MCSAWADPWLLVPRPPRRRLLLLGDSEWLPRPWLCPRARLAPALPTSMLTSALPPPVTSLPVPGCDRDLRGGTLVSASEKAGRCQTFHIAVVREHAPVGMLEVLPPRDVVIMTKVSGDNTICAQKHSDVSLSTAQVAKGTQCVG